MSKLMSLVLSFLLFFDFFGCAALRENFAKVAGLEMMQLVAVNPQYDDNGELLTCQYELHWDGREYEPFGGVFGNDAMGELFGLALYPGPSGRYGTDRVFLAAGQKPEEWLIREGGGFMMGFYMFFKEKSVTDIPDGFVPFGTE